MPNASEFDVLQNSTHRYTADIVDETGVAISGSDLTTLTLTLYDRASNTVINSRQEQNVLNTNGVSVNSSGALVWTGTGGSSGDNQILNSQRSNEVHVALFHWTFNSGAKHGYHQVLLNVRKLTNVPAFPAPGP